MGAGDASGPEEGDPLLRPCEAAAFFSVSVGAVALWERRGLLAAERTAGGHRRYRDSDVRRLAAEIRARSKGSRLPRRGGQAGEGSAR